MLETEAVENEAPVYSRYLALSEFYTLGGTLVFRARRVNSEKAQK